jgi:hypothetical protein
MIAVSHHACASQLAPSDSALKTFHDSVTADAQAKAKRAQVVSLVVSR